MGKMYISILGIDGKSEEAKKLTGAGSSSHSMDYADVVYGVIKNRFPKSSTITLHDVNQHLEAISYYYHNNQRKCISILISI